MPYKVNGRVFRGLLQAAEHSDECAAKGIIASIVVVPESVSKKPFFGGSEGKFETSSTNVEGYRAAKRREWDSCGRQDEALYQALLSFCVDAEEFSATVARVEAYDAETRFVRNAIRDAIATRPLTEEELKILRLRANILATRIARTYVARAKTGPRKRSEDDNHRGLPVVRRSDVKKITTTTKKFDGKFRTIRVRTQA